MRNQVLHPHTAAINQKQKNKSKKARLDALAWLAGKFPQVFDNTTCIRPLHLGIMNEILVYAAEASEAGISKSKLREAVVIFTRRLDYLACLKAREMRVDLQGNLTIPVTDSEAEHAAEKIKKRVEKSAKNARKNFAPVVKPRAAKASTAPEKEYSLHYSEPLFSENQVFERALPRPTQVTIKHKQTRQYDPDAVARLKQKLGLSSQREEKDETIEQSS